MGLPKKSKIKVPPRSTVTLNDSKICVENPTDEALRVKIVALGAVALSSAEVEEDDDFEELEVSVSDIEPTE